MKLDPKDAHSDALAGPLRRIADTMLAVLQTRLEILSTELAEERLNLTRLAIVAMVVLFCIQTGVILATLFIVLSVSDSNRVLAIGIAAGALLIGAVVALLWIRSWLKSRRPMFETTMNELRKDRERLG